MTRHSKNSTAGPIFTSVERSRLEYGLQKTRAGKDSFRSFDACHICLHQATDPVICDKGHLYCRSCIITSMLEQMEANRAKLLEHDRYLKDLEDVEERKRKVEEHEKIVNFLKEQGAIDEAKAIIDQEGLQPTKRAKADAGYWIPSATPVASPPKPIDKPDTKIYCKVESEAYHTISMKRLKSLNFVRSKEDKEVAVCPVCLKSLKNGIQLVVTIPCGHVFCEPCSSKYIDNSACNSCESKIEKRINLAKEGTGFASGGGKVLITKEDVAFQC